MVWKINNPQLIFNIRKKHNHNFIQNNIIFFKAKLILNNNNYIAETLWSVKCCTKAQTIS